MPNWTTLTLEKMRQLPLPAICNDVARWMKKNMTKAEVMEWLLDTQEIAEPVEIERNEQGQLTHRLEVFCDVETGKSKRNTETTYTYYPNGDIEDIIITRHDGDDNVTERFTIHHYQDGRQPIRIDS